MSNIGSIMMQLGDYKKARDYLQQSIQNVELRMYPSILEEEAALGSKAQQAKAQEMAKNKFLLCVRNF